MPSPQPDRLVRAIGRWSLFTLVLNLMIGSGGVKLPAGIAGMLGWWSPAAYLIAALGMGAIMAAFAEVASQFKETGGPYLYARETFGRFWGIQIAWMTWLSRIAAASGTANLFTTYLGQILPRATQPLYRLAI